MNWVTLTRSYCPSIWRGFSKVIIYIIEVLIHEHVGSVTSVLVSQSCSVWLLVILLLSVLCVPVAYEGKSWI